MYKLIIIPHTPIIPDHEKIAAPNFRNMDAPRRLYSPNIRISAKRKSTVEARQAIYEFFEFGEYDLNEISLDSWEVLT